MLKAITQGMVAELLIAHEIGRCRCADVVVHRPVDRLGEPLGPAPGVGRRFTALPVKIETAVNPVILVDWQGEMGDDPPCRIKAISCRRRFGRQEFFSGLG